MKKLPWENKVIDLMNSISGRKYSPSNIERVEDHTDNISYIGLIFPGDELDIFVYSEDPYSPEIDEELYSIFGLITHKSGNRELTISYNGLEPVSALELNQDTLIEGINNSKKIKEGSRKDITEAVKETIFSLKTNSFINAELTFYSDSPAYLSVEGDGDTFFEVDFDMKRGTVTVDSSALGESKKYKLNDSSLNKIYKELSDTF